MTVPVPLPAPGGGPDLPATYGAERPFDSIAVGGRVAARRLTARPVWKRCPRPRTPARQSLTASTPISVICPGHGAPSGVTTAPQLH